jgi:hypothetical protein
MVPSTVAGRRTARDEDIESLDPELQRRSAA